MNTSRGIHIRNTEHNIPNLEDIRNADMNELSEMLFYMSKPSSNVK